MAQEPQTELGKRLQGYAKCMLIWAVLRTVIGLLIIAKYLLEGTYPGGIVVWIIVALIIGLGLYLGVTGHLGMLAYTNRDKLKPFKILSIVGLVLSGIVLGIYIYWQAVGVTPAARDIFSTAVDFILYATGVFYAWRLSKTNN